MAFEINVYQAGYCTAPEKILIRHGRWQSVPVPALFFTLSHPNHGRILVDTGYAPRLHTLTKIFPYHLLAKLTPTFIEESQTAAAQVSPDTINHIILTHLHADHIAGLHDFPQGDIIYFEEAYAAVRHLSPFKSALAGFIPALLPDDFLARSCTKSAATCRPISYQNMPFTHGWDIFGDHSLIAVHLPGHAYGQMGLLVETADGTTFICADASWQGRTVQEKEAPHFLNNLLSNDGKEYRRTHERLQLFQQRRPDTPLYFSHCPITAEQVKS